MCSDGESCDDDDDDEWLSQNGLRLGRQYVRLPVCLVCIAELLTTNVVGNGPDESGGMMRQASEELASWCCRESSWVSSYSSAIELGAGVGLVSIALAKLGVGRTVATDGDSRLVRLIQMNAARNGVRPPQLVATKYRWEDEPDELLSAAGERGKCSPLILASDVLYSSDAAHFDRLERALRGLIARGGCRLIVLSWHVRNCNEEAFLPRLADLGVVSTRWRSHGLQCDDAQPTSDETAIRQWRSAHTGTWAIAALEVSSECEEKTHLSALPEPKAVR